MFPTESLKEKKSGGEGGEARARVHTYEQKLSDIRRKLVTR